jgi:hypothetical protein
MNSSIRCADVLESLKMGKEMESKGEGRYREGVAGCQRRRRRR